MGEALEGGKVTVWLEGDKLRGGFALIKTGKPEDNSWLLLKMRDEYAQDKGDVTKQRPNSAKTGRSLEDIAKP